MKYEIRIIADTNDADYVTGINTIDEKTLEIIKPVIRAIKDFKPYENKGHSHSHNFPSGEFVRDDLGEKSAEELYGDLKGFEDFLDYCPCGEHGIHTVERVEVYPVPKKERLL